MNRRIKPGQLLIISYLLVDLAGTLLLFMPFAANKPTTLLEAWFTATSALTVTGLTVVTTATHWNLFGQTVILTLMQIGGLGLMVLATVILTMLGLRIQLGHRYLVAQDRNYFNLSGVVRLVRGILLLTLVLEGIGGILMAVLLPEAWENGPLAGIFFIAFHAVSTFNGAGFDITGNSLGSFSHHTGFMLVVIVLIQLGSLGFVVLQEIFITRKWRRLSLHSRLVLYVTGIVTLSGTLFYFLSTFNNSIADFSAADKIVQSLFHATTRTAGFTTLPVSGWTEPFIFLMVLMMFIGASPGSVGGGIKTTTFGTVLLAVWAIVRGKKEVVLFEREIDPGSVTKAFTVTVMAGLLAALSTLTLMVTEGLPLMPVLFEVISAMATAGLSMGITSELSAFGQILVGLLMFVGRIGILSVIIILAGKEKRRLHYMKEEILIG